MFLGRSPLHDSMNIPCTTVTISLSFSRLFLSFFRVPSSLKFFARKVFSFTHQYELFPWVFPVIQSFFYAHYYSPLKSCFLPIQRVFSLSTFARLLFFSNSSVFLFDFIFYSRFLFCLRINFVRFFFLNVSTHERKSFFSCDVCLSRSKDCCEPVIVRIVCCIQIDVFIYLRCESFCVCFLVEKFYLLFPCVIGNFQYRTEFIFS